MDLSKLDSNLKVRIIRISADFFELKGVGYCENYEVFLPISAPQCMQKYDPFGAQ